MRGGAAACPPRTPALGATRWVRAERSGSGREGPACLRSPRLECALPPPQPLPAEGFGTPPWPLGHRQVWGGQGAPAAGPRVPVPPGSAAAPFPALDRGALGSLLRRPDKGSGAGARGAGRRAVPGGPELGAHQGAGGSRCVQGPARPRLRAPGAAPPRAGTGVSAAPRGVSSVGGGGGSPVGETGGRTLGNSRCRCRIRSRAGVPHPGKGLRAGGSAAAPASRPCPPFVGASHFSPDVSLLPSGVVLMPPAWEVWVVVLLFFSFPPHPHCFQPGPSPSAPCRAAQRARLPPLR